MIIDPCFPTHRQTVLNIHPKDYLLIEAAAHARGLQTNEFIELAAYLCAKEIIAQGDEQLVPENHSVTHSFGRR